MSQESGVNVALRYVREATRGTTPAGVGTAVSTVTAVASGGSSGLSKFTRGSGSWVTDGFVAGQIVRTTGFSTSANNGDWRVYSVSATDLVVEDSGDVVADEATAGTVRILLIELRGTTRALNLEKATLESDEVRSDLQVADVRHGFNRVVGSPGFELSSQSYDDLLEVMFGGTWTAVTTVSGVNISADTSTKKFTRASGSFVTDGYRPGDIVRVTGFSNANDADWQVTAVSATELTVSDPDGVMVTVSSGSGRTIAYPGKRLDLGTNLKTLTIERAFAGVGKYQAFRGCALTRLALGIRPEAIVSGTFDILGMIAAAMSGSSISGTTASPRLTTTPLASFEGSIYEGGSVAAVVTGLDVDLNANRSLAAVIGSKYSPDVYQGRIEAGGTLVAFFEDETMLNKFVNETESSIYVKLEDPAAPTTFISLVIPRVKYTGAMIDPPQVGPLPLQMPFRALVPTSTPATGAASCITIQRSNQYS